MLKSYPLYDTLLQKVKNRDNETVNDFYLDLNKVYKTINNIAQDLKKEDAIEHYKEMYLLMVHHELLNNNGMLFSDVAYEGTLMYGERGIVYELQKLPPMLLKIISEYINMYSK